MMYKTIKGIAHQVAEMAVQDAARNREESATYCGMLEQ